MTTTQEALYLAKNMLEFVLKYPKSATNGRSIRATLDTIREVQEQPAEQEMPGYHVENIYKRGIKYFALIGTDYVQVYTTPPSQREWTCLTDDEIGSALDNCEYDEDTPYFVSEARAIEAKLKEKNNPLTKSNTGE